MPGPVCKAGDRTPCVIIIITNTVLITLASSSRGQARKTTVSLFIVPLSEMTCEAVSSQQTYQSVTMGYAEIWLYEGYFITTSGNL